MDNVGTDVSGAFMQGEEKGWGSLCGARMCLERWNFDWVRAR